MKLTPDQIEVERKKFEAVYLKSHGFHGCFYRVEAVFQYVHSNVENCFQFWLACRESNNEIIAPAKIQIHSRLGERYLNGMNDGFDKFTDALEFQGFHVKSQGE